MFANGSPSGDRVVVEDRGLAIVVWLVALPPAPALVSSTLAETELVDASSGGGDGAEKPTIGGGGVIVEDDGSRGDDENDDNDDDGGGNGGGSNDDAVVSPSGSGSGGIVGSGGCGNWALAVDSRS